MFGHDLPRRGRPVHNGAHDGRCPHRPLPHRRHARRAADDADVSRRRQRSASIRYRRELVASAQVTYLEGYLWDPPHAKEAFLKATRAAHDAGRRVALTLSDPFCVDRYRDEFVDLVRNQIDILFANEAEITSLYQVPSFDDALERVRGQCEIAALTRSEKGCVIVADGAVHVVAAEPARVVDTTGAGDLFAAGFLYGFTRGYTARPAGVRSGPPERTPSRWYEREGYEILDRNWQRARRRDRSGRPPRHDGRVLRGQDPARHRVRIPGRGCHLRQAAAAARPRVALARRPRAPVARTCASTSRRCSWSTRRRPPVIEVIEAAF